VAASVLLRGASGLACALCVGAFFRNQIANGFTLLLGDRHDAVIALSILEHWRNVLAGAAEWSRTGYFHPVPDTLGYNDGYFLFGLVYAAIRAAGADPFLGGELTNVALRAVGFLAMHGACRRVLGLPFGWSLLGAALFTLSNNLFIRASHAQLFSIGFLPALALLLHEAGSALFARRRAALLGWGAGFVLLFAALLMTGFYMAWYFLFLAGATFLAWLAIAGDPPRRALVAALRAQPAPLGALAALAVVANLPFLLLYLPKAAETGMHPWEMALQHAPTPLDVLHVGEANVLFGWLVALLNDAFRPGFPAWSERMTGLTPVLLLLFAASLVWLWRGAGGGVDPSRRAWLQALAVATLTTWDADPAFRRRDRVVARLERRARRQGDAGGGTLPARPGDPRGVLGDGGPRGLGAAHAGGADRGACGSAVVGAGERLRAAVPGPAARAGEAAVRAAAAG
jgi:hypothetical protein